MNDLPVGRSVDETLRLVQAFQYTDKHGEVCPANWTPGMSRDLYSMSRDHYSVSCDAYSLSCDQKITCSSFQVRIHLSQIHLESWNTLRSIATRKIRKNCRWSSLV